MGVESAVRRRANLTPTRRGSVHGGSKASSLMPMVGFHVIPPPHHVQSYDHPGSGVDPNKNGSPYGLPLLVVTSVVTVLAGVFAVDPQLHTSRGIEGCDLITAGGDSTEGAMELAAFQQLQGVADGWLVAAAELHLQGSG
jgi:hypothetical protein